MVDTSKYNPGQLIHMDITFLVLPLQEDLTVHSTLLMATLENFGLFSPVQNEHPFVVIEIRIDGEGALTHSAKFTSLIIDEFPGIHLLSTGGYTPWLNGKIERTHETLKNTTHAILLDA
eukprot:1578291-Ditylum_brightwellii.AAC.1